MTTIRKPEIDGIIISGKVYDVLAEQSERSCEGCSLYGLGSCGMSYHCTHLKCIFQFNKELTDKLTNCNKLYAE